MRVLGIETSCDETGVALYCSQRGLLAQALHSQVKMHARYGGVVPELASRDHIRRLLPLTQQVLTEAGLEKADLDAIAFTEGPGLAGALLVGAAFASSMAWALNIPSIGIHHLEGHLLSPLLSSTPPVYPFLALLVSGGHTQLLAVKALGQYDLIGDTLDDAAGEAFDKSAKLLGLGYPGGPAIAAMAEKGRSGVFKLPRPMLHSGNFDFSFSGLKTAVLTRVKKGLPDEQARCDLAFEVQAAIVEVLLSKSIATLQATGLTRLVVAGGVSANQTLRAELAKAQARHHFEVFFPELALCTDNGAMIAYAGALRLQAANVPMHTSNSFSVRPRWPLEELRSTSGS